MANMTPDPDELRIDADTSGPETVVRVAGDVDIDTSPALATALQDLPDRPVRLDLSAVSFMDSSGLAVLVNAVQAGVALTVHNPSPTVRRIVQVTGLATTVEVDEA